MGSTTAEAVIEAIAIITTNYASGRSEAWVQSTNDELWQQGQLLSQPAEISLPHILASAALPCSSRRYRSMANGMVTAVSGWCAAVSSHAFRR